ncbi:MAG TPA: DNA polymerase III subunit gamma/tau, partial [Patescibacteria group bacterium]|nr:DNA polymerase III subunit gamma/tau [Patescibacteria group bacterium]
GGKLDNEVGLSDNLKEKKIIHPSKNQPIKLQNQTSNLQLQTSRIEPCNQCENCLAIARGNHIDVYEIDAASNRGIDEIRDLRERISLSPAMGRKKVYIIDEVHMLTTEAFNALLKTLEEPPPHVSFILATTEAHKLPKTIVSRCFVLRFTRANDEEIIRSLRRVVTGEKLAISDDALSVIARAADGSFRDATKLLEQAVSERALEKKEIEKLTGAYFDDEILLLLSAKKTKEALEYIQQRETDGVDFIALIAGLVERLHGMLLAKHGIELNDQTINLPNDQFKTDDIDRLIRLLSRAYLETKTSFIPSLPLELAVIEYCNT